MKTISFRWRLIPTESIQLDTTASFYDMYIPSMGLYVCWQVTYLVLTGSTAECSLVCPRTFTWTVRLFTEVVYKSTLQADPSLITSLRYLTRDTKNPMNQLITDLCRRAGLVSETANLDPEKPLAKVMRTSLQTTIQMCMSV